MEQELNLIDELRARLAQLEYEEKQAWAQLNAILGAAGELRRLLSALTGEDEDGSIDTDADPAGAADGDQGAGD